MANSVVEKWKDLPGFCPDSPRDSLVEILRREKAHWTLELGRA